MVNNIYLISDRSHITLNKEKIPLENMDRDHDKYVWKIMIIIDNFKGL